MADSRIALVTGATQGLGRALVAGLAARLRPDDHVLLTGRNPETVAAETIAAETIAAGRLAGSGAQVHGRVPDVTDTGSVQAAADAGAAEYRGGDNPHPQPAPPTAPRRSPAPGARPGA